MISKWNSLNGLCLALPIVLTGCSIKPLEPYTEPAAGTPTAALRVITNGGVIGSPYKGCIDEQKYLAIAGRFKDGSPSINYLQQPEHPPRLEMPQRFAPAMPELAPVLRRAEGSYSEVVAEYKVPAGEPFLLSSLGAAAGGMGNSYLTCPGDRGVFKFEPNKNYEMMAGMVNRPDKDGKPSTICLFTLYELKPLAGTKITIPVRLEPTKSSDSTCSK